VKFPIGVFFLIMATSCAGCAMTDPYQRAGMWQPSGAVQANLAAMVANPGDLVTGHGDGQAAQYQTTGAVDRLWADQTKPLLGDTDQQSGSQSASGSGSGSINGDLSVTPASSSNPSGGD
jgi:type IV pilus biogenesis protein CpaD/CtpE